METLKIINILCESKLDGKSATNKEVIRQVHELQEILIQDCIHRITDVKYLKALVDGLQTKSSHKNEEYRLINLIWSVADYFK